MREVSCNRLLMSRHPVDARQLVHCDLVEALLRAAGRGIYQRSVPRLEMELYTLCAHGGDCVGALVGSCSREL